MKASMGITNPDDVDVSMTLTMTLGRWKALKNQLDGHAHPSWWLAYRIRDMICETETHITQTFETDE